METGTKPAIRNLNQPAYAIFLLAGIYFLIQQDFSQAVIYWGLALVFDPFNIPPGKIVSTGKINFPTPFSGS